ncbi:MAG: response regulator transcription factor [Tissierellaceae bacterium]|nr:response regulator transcription factor [Tissierellaceae bacterium]
MNDNVLIVDDDKTFAESIRYTLQKDRFNIEIIKNGKSLKEKIESNNYKLVLIEPETPGIQGVDVCKSIREISTIPLIVISQNNNDINKILAFEYGADDYLVKPFNILELKARINSLFRRMSYKSTDEDNYLIHYGEFTIDAIRRRILYHDNDLNLTGKEFDLFYVLSTNPGKVFTREELLKQIWGYEYFGDLRTVDVHIRRIREKIEKSNTDNQYIATKWGVGYFFIVQ